MMEFRERNDIVREPLQAKAEKQPAQPRYNSRPLAAGLQ